MDGDETEVEDDSDPEPTTINVAVQNSTWRVASLASFTTADLTAPRSYTSPYAASYFAAPQVRSPQAASEQTAPNPSEDDGRTLSRSVDEDEVSKEAPTSFDSSLRGEKAGEGSSVASGGIPLKRSSNAGLNNIPVPPSPIHAAPVVGRKKITPKKGKAAPARRLGAAAQADDVLALQSSEETDDLLGGTQADVTHNVDKSTRTRGRGTHMPKSKAGGTTQDDSPSKAGNTEQSSIPSVPLQPLQATGKRVRKPSAKAAAVSSVQNNQNMSLSNDYTDPSVAPSGMTDGNSTPTANGESGIHRSTVQQSLLNINGPSRQPSAEPIFRATEFTIAVEPPSIAAIQSESSTKTQRKRKRSNVSAPQQAITEVPPPKRLAVDATTSIASPPVVDTHTVVVAVPQHGRLGNELSTSSVTLPGSGTNGASDAYGNGIPSVRDLSTGETLLRGAIAAIPSSAPPEKVPAKRKRTTKFSVAKQLPPRKENAFQAGQTQNAPEDESPNDVLRHDDAASTAHKHTGHNISLETASTNDPDLIHQPQQNRRLSTAQDSIVVPEATITQSEVFHANPDASKHSPTVHIDPQLAASQIVQPPQEATEPLPPTPRMQETQPIPVSQKQALSIPPPNATPLLKPSLLLKFALPSASLRSISERPEPKFTQASIGWANRRRIAAELTAKLEEAIKVPILEGTYRLACANQQLPGNLILSADRDILEFWDLKQHPPQLPMFVTRVSDIEKDPTVSPRGANPITIRFKCGDTWKGPGQTMVFIVSQTAEGYLEMQRFREQLVSAREAFPYQREVTPEGAETYIPNTKKYLCEKCQGRFKNKNGLEYHLEKSQTACNPNFDFASKPPKERKSSVRKVNAELNAANASVRPKRSRKSMGETENETEGKENGEDGGNSSDSSIDSIYKWAQKVADKNKTETSTTTRKRYKAYNGEAEAFQLLAKTPNSDLYPSVEGSEIIPEPVNPIGITPAFCSEMIVEMLEKNGGIFSSDKGIWFAIVNAWLLNYKTVEFLPGSKMCFQAIDDLVDEGKLQKINFVFRDKKSRDVPRNIFLTADYSGGEEAMAAVKAAIASTHPAIYVPEDFAPPPKAFSALQNLVTRVFNKPAASPVVNEDIESSGNEEDFEGEDESEEDDMSMDGTPDDVSEDLNGEPMDEDMMQTKRNRRKGTKGGRASKNISKGVIAWHVKRRAAGLEGPLTKRTIRRHELLAGAPTQRERARMKADKEKAKAEVSGAWSKPLITYLQNPRTGEWGLRPVKRNLKIEANRVRARDIGVGVVEPITYFQNETGAWNNRAFGHGVKPIFARPSKRQSMSSYLKTLGKGFRPVLIPDQYVEQEQKRKEELDKYRQEKLERSQRSARKNKDVKRHVSFDLFDDNSADDDFVPGDEEQDDDIGEGSAVETQSSGEENNEQSRNPRTYFFNPSARRNRTKIQKHQDPHELDYEGHELEQLSQIRLSYMPNNPGLDTLPTFFGLEQYSDVENEADENFETYTAIKFSTPQIATPQTSLDDGSWTLMEPFTSANDKYDNIRFDGRTRFDVDNLLYYTYERMEDEDLPEDQLDAKRIRLTDQLQRVNPHNVHMVNTAKNNRIARIKRLIPTRALTAIEADFEGLTEYPNEVAESLGVEVLPATSGEYARKRLRLGNKMSSAEITRFLVAIVVVRTLTGGIDQFVDWIIVQTLFPEYSLNYLDKVWRNVVRYKEKEELIDELGIDFQDAYLVAYKHGTVDKLDYDNLLQHDWSKLVMWTMKTLDTSFAPKMHKLTAKRSDMSEEYYSAVNVRDPNEPQTMYFHSTAPIYRRLDASASSASTLDVDMYKARSSKPGSHHDIVLESWARAAALTPVELWNSKLSFVKLTKYSNEHLESAITTLVEKKVIIKRQRQRWTTGRAYEGSDAFITPLRKPLAGNMVVDAARYKQKLDEAFLRGEVVDVDYLGDDGSYMCISHLQACGHILITEYDVPMDPMGLGDDLHPYDTKRLPVTKIRWKMSMQPTPSYLYDEDNRHLATLQTSAAPLPADSPALPVWYTILGELFPEMWKRVICAVNATIVQRTGISTKSLGIVFTPTLELWELKLLLKWGHKAGLWQPIDDDSDSEDEYNEKVDGWCSTTHWWVLLGVIVTDMDAAAAQQKARYEALKSEKERAKANPEADYSAEPEAMDIDDGKEGVVPDIEHDDVHITTAASNEQEFLAARMFAGRVKVAFEDAALDSRIQVDGPRELGRARGETTNGG